MTELQQQILRTILYFDLFAYPLREEEVFLFCSEKTERKALHMAINSLLRKGVLKEEGGYFLLPQTRATVEERKRKWAYSCKLIPKARRNGSLIYAFPFVRAVAISGSLSKYSADEKADIDYFIISAENRLWICRSFLHFFKKVTYLLGRQHDFCMNYFLDEAELELKDKNFYTAVEGTTIIPVNGRPGIEKFLAENQWMFSFFPNFDPARILKSEIRDRRPRAKKLVESLLGGRVGSALNKGLYALTVRWWRWKFRRSGFPMENFDRDLRSTPGESKYHPHDYQRSILQRWAERERAFFKNSSVLRDLAP